MSKQDISGHTPSLRFPEFKDCGPWRAVTLSMLAAPVTERVSDGENKSALTLSGEKGLVPQVDSFGERASGDNTIRQVKIIRDDFVYNDQRTKRSRFGSINRLTAIDSGSISPNYKCFRFNSEQHPEFWDYYFEARAHEPQLGKFVNEGPIGWRLNVPINKFLSIRVWSPTSPEQERIGELLSSIDDLINLETEKLRAFKDHKNGLMQRLFPAKHETTPKLRFPEFHNSGDWVLCELNLETELISGGIAHKDEAAGNSGSGRVARQSQDAGLSAPPLDDAAHIDGTAHQNMPTTETIINEALPNVTAVSFDGTAVADKRVTIKYADHQDSIMQTVPPELNISFLNQFLFWKHGQARIDAHQVGTNRHGPNCKKMYSFILPIPRKTEEQERVQAILQSADICISGQAKKIDNLRNHKLGLLQNIFPVLSEVRG